ncbi:MAG TPA: ABC transporter permease [Eubacteriales bacterium]|nr:ABC transporter permease [Eubacteriales bacterium]
MAEHASHTIIATRKKTLRSVLLRWETLLIVLFIAVNVMNASISKNYLNVDNLFTAISAFLVRGFIAMPMAYVLVLGEIDLSVGSTVALSATLLGVSYNAGMPMGVSLLIALAAGALCGLVNGLILTVFTELSPMIVTLGTMTLFRGAAEIILGSTSTGGLHNCTWFYNVYYAKLGSVPYIFIVFCVLAVLFGFTLHKTTFGRYIYAIGSNRIAARYAGIPVQRVRLICYTLVGLVCGISAVFYGAWMGTIRSDIATGYELEAISMAVLGGISTVGGKGNFPGTVISIFTIGLLRYGLGLANVNTQTILMIIGGILILMVMLPNVISASTLKHAKVLRTKAGQKA